MPRYIIERLVPGLTREELAAAGRRSVVTLAGLPEVRWIRSYVSDAEGKIYCEYDAPSIEAIREHARRAGLPADRISEVSLFTVRLDRDRRRHLGQGESRLPTNFWDTTLAPSRRFVRADPEQGLCHDFVGQHRVRRVDAPEASIAKQLFQPALPEDPESSCNVERQIDHAP